MQSIARYKKAARRLPSCSPIPQSTVGNSASHAQGCVGLALSLVAIAIVLIGLGLYLKQIEGKQESQTA